MRRSIALRSCDACNTQHHLQHIFPPNNVVPSMASGERVLSYGDVLLRSSDLESLQEGRWLNDQVRGWSRHGAAAVVANFKVATARVACVHTPPPSPYRADPTIPG